MYIGKCMLNPSKMYIYFFSSKYGGHAATLLVYFIFLGWPKHIFGVPENICTESIVQRSAFDTRRAYVSTSTLCKYEYIMLVLLI